jgi:hypothetical protein
MSMSASPIRPRAALALSVRQHAPKGDSRLLLAFIFFEMACQLALLSGAISGARVFVRVAAFAASLVMLFWSRGSGLKHPSSRFAIAALVVIGLGLLNPLTSPLAGSAQAAFYLSVLAPIFWIPCLSVDMSAMRRVLLAMWAFQSLSAVVGALQVYFPGQFVPALATSLDDTYLESLRITLANGESVYRPMGLTDTPGGAGVAGYYAVLLGLGFLLDRPRWWFRALLVASMLAGMFAIYLSQLRSILIMLGVSVIAIGAILGIQRRLGKLLGTGALLAAILGGSFALAVAAGGNTVTDRLGTLLEADPQEVYYSNRGRFLEATVTELVPLYPLGAGLGRWGMISNYFGDRTDREHGPIWVEIQMTGWLLDGGIPLVFAYTLAVLNALWISFKVATRTALVSEDRLTLWASILVGYNLGAVALTFNYPLFMGTLGLEFWILNASLFAASLGFGTERRCQQGDENAAASNRAIVT